MTPHPPLYIQRPVWPHANYSAAIQKNLSGPIYLLIIQDNDILISLLSFVRLISSMFGSCGVGGLRLTLALAVVDLNGISEVQISPRYTTVISTTNLSLIKTT